MILARVIEEQRLAARFGVRPTRTFEAAAARFILEHQHKRSLRDDIGRLKGLMPYLGGLPLHAIHMGTLQRGSIPAGARAGPRARSITVYSLSGGS
jgi:hypothetical protein